MVDVFFEARILGYDRDCLEQCSMGEKKWIEDAVSVEMDLHVSSNDLAPFSFSIRLRVAETISLCT